MYWMCIEWLCKCAYVYMYRCISFWKKNLLEFTHSKLRSSRYSDDLLLFVFVCRTVSPGSSINYSKFIMSVKLGIKWTSRIFKKKISSILLDILTDKVCGLDKQGTMFLNCKIHNPRVMDHGIGVGCHWSYIKNRANKLLLTRLFNFSPPSTLANSFAPSWINLPRQSEIYILSN